MDQRSNSASAVGSRGTLIALMDKEIEMLQAVKICSRHADLRAPTPTPAPAPPTPSPSSSSSSSSSHVLRSSALWSDLKGFLKSSTTGHYAPTILFCKDEVNPEHGVQEACHIRTPRGKDLGKGRDFSKERDLKQLQRRHHQRGGKTCRVYATEEGRKGDQRRNAKAKAKRDGYHSDDQKQGRITMETLSDDGDHAKPMLGYYQQHQHRHRHRHHHRTSACACDDGKKPLRLSSRPQQGGSASNLASMVDLQSCCAFHPLSQRLGFTRLSNI